MDDFLEKIRTLVVRLVDRTKAGKSRWVKGSRERTFVLTLPDYSVVAKDVLDDEGDSHYYVTLIDSDGAEIESFSNAKLTDDGGQYWTTSVQELYEVARRSALGTDKAVDKLLSELDDDIPF